MFLLINIISFFWWARTIKAILFWVYLWQLKEYHVGRFLDHFRTASGKKIFYNWLFLSKIILVFLLSIQYELILYVIFAIYLAESALFFQGIAQNRIKKPVFTAKAKLLTIVSIALYLFLVHGYIKNGFLFYILIFDILTPVFVSLVVLMFQPFFVYGRNKILKKAKEKIRGFENLTVIAITGSYGKTTTKEFLKTILSEKFSVLATPEHKNSEMGIAQTILEDLHQEHEIFIVEMGAYNKGGIRLLCDMVRPSIGLVVGVNEQHLATFGSLENLLSAEGGGELLEHLPKDGLLIVNGDNKYCLDLYKKAGNNKKLYTLNKHTIHSDIWTEELDVHKNFISFIAVSSQKELAHFNVYVLGGHNVQNMLGAILVAKELGMSFEEISMAAKNIHPNQAGIILYRGLHGMQIIDSSYSSNPDGVMADLDYLSVFEGKKVMVMPCLIELGGKSAHIHHAVGKKIASVCDLAIITTRDQFESLRFGALESGMAEEQIILCDNAREILAHITTFCKEGDSVLLEGRVPRELIESLNYEMPI